MSIKKVVLFSTTIIKLLLIVGLLYFLNNKPVYSSEITDQLAAFTKPDIDIQKAYDLLDSLFSDIKNPDKAAEIREVAEWLRNNSPILYPSEGEMDRMFKLKARFVNVFIDYNTSVPIKDDNTNYLYTYALTFLGSISTCRRVVKGVDDFSIHEYLESMFNFLAMLNKGLDPDFNPKKLPYLNISVPGGDYNIGCPVEAVKEPELCAAYEKAIQDNSEYNDYYKFQSNSRRLLERYSGNMRKVFDELNKTSVGEKILADYRNNIQLTTQLFSEEFHHSLEQ